MSLTVVTIRNAKPQDKPYKLSDSGGLFLLVQPNGGKWWRYKYRFAGKEKLLSLGIYPDVSLAEARDYHIQARKILAAGKDPSSVKQEAKRLAIQNRENSFEAIANEWIENRKGSWTTKYTKNVLSRLKSDIFPKIGNRPIAEITAQELLSVFRAIEDRGVNEIALAHINGTTSLDDNLFAVLLFKDAPSIKYQNVITFISSKVAGKKTYKIHFSGYQIMITPKATDMQWGVTDGTTLPPEAFLKKGEDFYILESKKDISGKDKALKKVYKNRKKNSKHDFIPFP